MAADEAEYVEGRLLKSLGLPSFVRDARKMLLMRVILSAASAASPMLPWVLVIGETALAADLITRLIFKHLEQDFPIYAKQPMSVNTVLSER